eukprot:CAMPEP_0182480328 /NCGR_PEP_ID=MMETSP1319-20130603/35611_1 /TAXON_ID=172717 /ORGANISM="Bolidomonas pacifica, Strain RCC208" /LENGTH=630 /DNA_ID=CAMNT_0024681809 /DNA_START=241 /DNA_END=2129 /DNA_ORIENTATION=+
MESLIPPPPPPPSSASNGGIVTFDISSVPSQVPSFSNTNGDNNSGGGSISTVPNENQIHTLPSHAESTTSTTSTTSAPNTLPPTTSPEVISDPMISGPISGPPDDNSTTTNDIDNNTDTNNDTNINVPYTTPTTLPHELSMLTELSNLFAHQHSSTAALINQVKASIDGLKYDFENYKKRIAREMKEKEDEIHSLRVLVGSGGRGGPADFAGRSDDEGGIPNYASGARKKMFKYKDDVEEEDALGYDNTRKIADAYAAAKDKDGAESSSEDEAPDVLLYKAKDFSIPYSRPTEAKGGVEVPRERSKTTRVVLYYAKDKGVLDCPLASFCSSTPWSQRPDYGPAGLPERETLFNTVRGIMSPSKVPAGSSELPELDDDKNLSCLVLYEGSAPVCCVTFILNLQTSRCFAEILVMRTRKGYRRRGHAKSAVACIKELLINSPATEHKGAPHSAFLWSCVTRRSRGFFESQHVGFAEGWGKFQQVTGDTPQLRPNGVKVHVVVNKLLAGHYVASVVDGRWTPVLASMERKRRVDYDSTAEYKPGTAVEVFFPKIGSKRTYRGTVLDYNPLHTKPYYIEYEDDTTEHVVPKRIKGLAEDADDEEVAAAAGAAAAASFGEAAEGAGGEEEEREEE